MKKKMELEIKIIGLKSFLTSNDFKCDKTIVSVILHGNEQPERLEADLFFCVVALKKCEVPVDIAFLLDSSASLGERGYQKMKDFVKAVANTFEIGPMTTCAGVIIYGTDAITAVRFADASNNVIFNAAVDTMPYLRGETRIDKALHLAHSELLSHRRGARKGVAKVVIVLTDGRQSQVPSRVDIQNAIAPLLSAGIRVFAIGVGEEVEKDELQLLVEKKEDAISVPSYDLLMEHARVLSIATCESSGMIYFSRIFPFPQYTQESRYNRSN